MQRTSLIFPTLRAECKPARVGSDKSIGWQAIFKGNRVNKLGGSRCTDLTKTRRSDPCLINCNNTTNPVSKGREGGKNFDSLQQVLTALYNRTLKWTLNSSFELI